MFNYLRISVQLFSSPNNNYLWKRRANPNTVEYRVSEQPLEDITLAMDFSGVDLIEEGHHNESVEDNSEVLRRFRSQGVVAAWWDV